VGKSTGDVAGSAADRPSTAGVEISTDGQNQQQHKTFAAMLRNSKFVQMGDPVGKVVVGKIYHIVNDDLYIDFGGKFPAVCTANRKRRALYTRGTEVRLLIKELELSKTFLGYDKEITLMEADAVLLGLHNAPAEESTRFPSDRES